MYAALRARFNLYRLVFFHLLAGIRPTPLLVLSILALTQPMRIFNDGWLTDGIWLRAHSRTTRTEVSWLVFFARRVR